MTTLRTAAQQALEALEEVQKYGTTTEWFDERVSALRAALAEPVQEPVALNDGRLWQYPDGSIGIGSAPPQRKPMTEEEIYSLFRTVASPVMFARAIERAHGIT